MLWGKLVKGYGVLRFVFLYLCLDVEKTVTIRSFEQCASRS